MCIAGTGFYKSNRQNHTRHELSSLDTLQQTFFLSFAPRAVLLCHFPLLSGFYSFPSPFILMLSVSPFTFVASSLFHTIHTSYLTPGSSFLHPCHIPIPIREHVLPSTWLIPNNFSQILPGMLESFSLRAPCFGLPRHLDFLSPCPSHMVA